MRGDQLMKKPRVDAGIRVVNVSCVARAEAARCRHEWMLLMVGRRRVVLVWEVKIVGSE